MSAPFERRAITFNDKPVLLYVSAPPRIGRPFLARCHGATLAAQDDGLTEDQYIARIRVAAAELGLLAELQRRDDHEIAFDVKLAPKR